MITRYWTALSTHRRAMAALAGGVLTLAGLAGAALTAVPASAATAISAPKAATRSVRNDALYGVSCPGKNHCVAVGTRAVGTAANLKPLAEVWNGTTWRTMSVPAPSSRPRVQLSQVSCQSASNCVAVGYHYNPGGSGLYDLAESWNGRSWRITERDNPGHATGGFLNDVSCDREIGCMAVGAADEANGNGIAMAARWSGGRWGLTGAVHPTNTSASELNGVSCSGRICLAVGLEETRGGNVRVLAERYNGSVWKLLPAASVPGNSLSVLDAVACPSASHCEAVGFSDGTAERAFSESFTSSRGTLAAGGRIGNSALNGVACLSARSCVAVGDDGDNPLSESWHGGSWKVLRTPKAGGHPADNLSQIACAGGRCIAIGNRYQPDKTTGMATLAQEWNGHSWRIMSTPNP
jgi:uncharacterized membrane protein